MAPSCLATVRTLTEPVAAIESARRVEWVTSQELGPLGCAQHEMRQRLHQVGMQARSGSFRAMKGGRR